MKRFTQLLGQFREYERLAQCVDNGRTPVSVEGLSAPHKMHFISSLAAGNPDVPIVAITPDEATSIRLAQDLTTLLGEKVLPYPARDYVLLDVDGASREFEHQRIGVLSSLLRGDCRIVTVSIEAAAQLTMPRNILQESTLEINRDHSYNMEDVIGQLSAMGYQRCDQVEGVCQFARRGGILDIFPPNSPDPIRVEFWDDEIDTMSYFKVDTQRRSEDADNICIPPAREVLYGGDRKSVV